MPRGKKNKSATGALKRKQGKGAKYNKPSTLTFRIDGDLRQELKKIARDQYASESSLCNKYIAQGIQQDTFARAKKVERRIAALELSQDKEGLQSAQALVEQLGALGDRVNVIEGAISSLTKVLEKIQDHLESDEESDETPEVKASDDDEDEDDIEDDEDLDEDEDEDDEDLDEDDEEDEDDSASAAAAPAVDDEDDIESDDDEDDEEETKSEAA